MKPWEETWSAEDNVVTFDDRGEHERHASEGVFGRFQSGAYDLIDSTERDNERARLAACAPDLVRVLLDVEWAGRNQWGIAVCPRCGGEEYFEGELRTGHLEYCALDAALRKAGVR